MSADLDRTLIRLVAKQRAENLPDFHAYLDREPKAKRWIADQESRLLHGIRDVDEVLFDDARRTWTKACARVNENLAEEYRQAHPEPEEWELRYLRWMVRVVYLKIETPLGEFFLVPRRPSRRPSSPNWYTVDEMIDMLHPGIVAAIQMAGSLPIRPETLRGPRPGEKILHMDFTSGKLEAHYDYEGAVHAGARVR